MNELDLILHCINQGPSGIYRGYALPSADFNRLFRDMARGMQKHYTQPFTVDQIEYFTYKGVKFRRGD